LIFPLKRSSIFVPNVSQSIFNWVVNTFGMNKRFIIVGVILGIAVLISVIIGSPAIGGFDAMR
jgi:hypothetical protein